MLKKGVIRFSTASLTAFIFLLNSFGYTYAAAGDLSLPLPGTMVNLSPAFEPVLIKGLKVHPENPFLFDFIIDTGNDQSVIGNSSDAAQSLKAKSATLIKYFLAAMTVPEKDLWVNLSPYEKDRMIAQNLGQTEMGRDMLAQDYILKQLTASLIYPEKNLGKRFWDTVYAKAQEMYGTTQIPVNTFNKVWIVADKADIFERGNTAYIVGAHLKVMLEEDYLVKDKHQNTQAASVTSQVVRQIILPQLENEVNTGKNFAPLRQMFYSMVLASWYKMALKDAILTQIYGNQSKVKVGINASDLKEKDAIFHRYLQAYKKGVFNYIKDDEDQATKEFIPRKYFSGGLQMIPADPAMLIHRRGELLPGDKMVDHAVIARVNTYPQTLLSTHILARDILMEILLGNISKDNGIELGAVQKRINMIAADITRSQILQALAELEWNHFLIRTPDNQWKLFGDMEAVERFIDHAPGVNGAIAPLHVLNMRLDDQSPVDVQLSKVLKNSGEEQGFVGALRRLAAKDMPTAKLFVESKLGPQAADRFQAEQVIIQGLNSKDLLRRAYALEAAAEFKYFDIKSIANDLMNLWYKSTKDKLGRKAAIMAAGVAWVYFDPSSDENQQGERILKEAYQDDQVNKLALTFIYLKNLAKYPDNLAHDQLQPIVDLVPENGNLLPLYKLAVMIDKYPAFQSISNWREWSQQVFNDVIARVKSKVGLYPSSLYVVRRELERERGRIKAFLSRSTIKSLQEYVDDQLRQGEPLAAAIRLSQLQSAAKPSSRIRSAVGKIRVFVKSGIQQLPLRIAALQAPTNGGIDLNSANMRMNISKDTNLSGAQLVLDQAAIQRIKRDGFDGIEFKIESILPVVNFP